MPIINNEVLTIQFDPCEEYYGPDDIDWDYQYDEDMYFQQREIAQINASLAQDVLDEDDMEEFDKLIF